MQSPDIYVSHASADLGWVNGVLGSALDRAGVKWTAESRFAAGTERVTAIGDAIQSSRILVLVFSSAYLADDWKQYESVLIEMVSVKKNRARIIPILKDPVTIPFALQRFKPIDFTDASNTHSALVSLFSALDGNNQLPLDKKPPCPYPGLYSFDESKSEYFFGRSREIRDLVNRLRRHNFVAVIGASGTGKSSLVRAGLPPALRASSQFGDAEWNVLTMRPGAHPLDTLRALLKTPPYNQTDTSANAEPIPSTVKPQNFLLIVDALEEELTLTRVETERQDFERALLELLRMPNWYIVATMRSDFYLQFRDSFLRDELLAHQLQLGPLDSEGLREAIREPARKVQVYVDEALVERLVSDAESDEGGSVLPLVQETLVRLWEIGLVERHLPLSAYSKIPGGLNGVLSEHAEQTFAELVTDEKKEIARRIFLQLIQVNDSPPDTRRPALLPELEARFNNRERFAETLNHLAHNRLVVLDGARADNTPQVDLAHERLIEKWTRLKEWIAQDRVGLQTAQTLERDAEEWERHKRASSFLYRGEQLRELTPWSRTHAEEFSESQREFLKASFEADKKQRFLISSAVVVGALLVLAVVALMVLQVGPFAQQLKWVREESGLPSVQASVIVRGDDGALYSGFGNNRDERLGESSIARKRPNRTEWEWLPIDKGRVIDFVVLLGEKNVLVGAFPIGGVWRSEDDGETWKRTGEEIPLSNIVALEVSPQDQVVYAIDPVKGVYSSLDKGIHWERVARSPIAGEPSGYYVSAHWDGARLLVVSGPKDARSDGREGVWELTPNGWRQLYAAQGKECCPTRVVRVGESVFAGGAHLWRLNTVASAEMLRENSVSRLDGIRGAVPKLLIAQDNGTVLILDAADGKELFSSTSADLGDAKDIFHVLAEPDGETFWVATDKGLFRGAVHSWWERLGGR